jgi:anthranilate synthase component 1
MEIIEDLEKVRRGPYGGTVGYFSLSGDMDMCIAIRTLVIQGGRAYLQGGAGIVADSEPRREWEETNNKIAALREAMALAESGFLK